jgi:hypothetical protein
MNTYICPETVVPFRPTAADLFGNELTCRLCAAHAVLPMLINRKRYNKVLMLLIVLMLLALFGYGKIPNDLSENPGLNDSVE